ncbi:response regulator [Oligoflexaceae bacterium]|nr:response regulator [Oligoflexaceae bacterium]
MLFDQKRVVLIDDDPIYLEIMRRYAELYSIALDVFSCLDDLGFVGNLRSYDLAIIDYDLGVVGGEDIATYVDAFLPDLPIILVSNSPRNPKLDRWPKSVKEFVLKEEGFVVPYLKATQHFKKSTTVL